MSININIQPASNKECYIVTTSWYDIEEGLIEEIAVVEPTDLGEYLMQYLPYDVKSKNNTTIKPKVENPKSNVQPFPCR